MASAFLLFNLCGLTTLMGQDISTSNLTVSDSKTTNIVFPYTIRGVDLGTGDILVRKAEGADHILQVKSAKADFEATNLSVITGDGKLHSFLLSYAKNPDVLNVVVLEASKKQDFKGKKFAVDEAILENNIRLVKQLSGQKAIKRERAFGVTMNLEGLYVQKNLFYLVLLLSNESALEYQLDDIRFFVCDNKQLKRTAFQEIELNPINMQGQPESVSSFSSGRIVCVLPKFTLADKKHLILEVKEKNGGRNFRMRLGNKDLIKAKLINE
ncbi:conjugative transposon protein TraN [Sphingobacterium sp. HJSM2_6]|uniref:conjugative transposon protein TraN n=1 Tax=Sphingobacterium sp. HJSM2_6 TaxID=3366264 RepID=UPI003BDB5EE8